MSLHYFNYYVDESIGNWLTICRSTYSGENGLTKFNLIKIPSLEYPDVPPRNLEISCRMRVCGSVCVYVCVCVCVYVSYSSEGNHTGQLVFCNRPEDNTNTG